MFSPYPSSTATIKGVWYFSQLDRGNLFGISQCHKNALVWVFPECDWKYTQTYWLSLDKITKHEDKLIWTRNHNVTLKKTSFPKFSS